MPNIKNSRAQRSLSSYICSLNKENQLDLGNRIQPINKKNTVKMVHEDDLVCQAQIKQLNPKMPKEALSTNIESPKIEIMSMSHVFKKEENNMIGKNYSCDIMDTLLQNDHKSRLSNILFTHNIPKDLRCRMIDWMIQVIGAFKFTDHSFFTAVRLMDTFFMKSMRSHQAQQVHLTGVTCMYIATKFQEVHPLKLKTVFQKIGHRKLSSDTILKKESDILNVMDFVLTGVNHYEIVIQIIFMIDLEAKIEKRYLNYLNKVVLYLSKMVLFELDIMTSCDYSTIACASLYVAFKIIQQVCPNFHPDREIIQALLCVDVNQQSMMETASKILVLAKSFDKTHHNLQNLRKFNGFSFEDTPNQNSQKPSTTR